jgi:Zn-dependent peptidase ImmA (M78 family)
MDNPVQSAISLLNRIGWKEPGDMSMEDIAWSCGLIVKYKEMDRSQGRIIMSQDEGIITVNSTISYLPKVNFILAHEIGHGQLHRHLLFFHDDNSTLSEWYENGPQEKEANTFAAELLMPSELFIKKVKNKKLDVSLIDEVAHYFGASKVATFLKYKDFGSFPVMVVFVEDGIIKWKSCSADFPYKWLTLGSRLPAYTVAGDYYYNQIEESKPTKVDAIEWFPEDFACQRDGNTKVWEQCFPTTSRSLFTCIWTA